MKQIQQKAVTDMKAQLRRLARSHIDRKTGELDMTALVEDWDQTWGDGSTTDPDHPAWTFALELKAIFGD